MGPGGPVEVLLGYLIMKKRVAYQGIKGSFSSMAASAMLGADFEALTTSRFRDIFEHVTSARADIGIIPIENALAGSVHENYDLLAEFNCSIIAEYYCPVQLHLMATGLLAGGVNELRQIISHPKALEQCSQFLEAHPLATPVQFSDTAGAALHVKQIEDPRIAAVASEEAANTYGLQIVAHAIQNHAINSTRFVAISAKPESLNTPSKCSLLITLPHAPGSLARILSEIAAFDTNVTKIESRPILGKPFEYKFYIDIESFKQPAETLVKVIEKIKSHDAGCRVLGIYGNY